jgi:hypothetical protein
MQRTEQQSRQQVHPAAPADQTGLPSRVQLSVAVAAIDYATCDVKDVIAHSLKLHPQLLADRLRFHARVDAEFADAYDDREVTQSELNLASRLRSFANAIEFGDYTIPDDFGVLCEAFSCAAWLQDLHSIMQRAIAERDYARNARPGRHG